MQSRKPIFDELDFRLNHLPRWSILPTIKEQTVAVHVHNVVRITSRIARLWFKLSDEELLVAILWAHHHDDDESIAGDIQAPAKTYFDKQAFEEDHESHFFPRPPEKIERIVKLADRMEWIYYLTMEVAMGNKFVSEQLRRNTQKLLALATEYFGDEIMWKVNDWVMNIDPTSRNFNRRW